MCLQTKQSLCRCNHQSWCKDKASASKRKKQKLPFRCSALCSRPIRTCLANKTQQQIMLIFFRSLNILQTAKLNQTKVNFNLIISSAAMMIKVFFEITANRTKRTK